jgi:hypothetical protein
MSKLYIETFERINSDKQYKVTNTDDEINDPNHNYYTYGDKICENFIHYLLEVMHQLANEHKTSEINRYRIYKHYSDYWFGLNNNLNHIRFLASNKYELWLKIYHYTKEITDDYVYIIDVMLKKSNLEEIFCTSYESTQNEYDAMKEVIDSVIYSWDGSDTLLWWSIDNTKFIEI